MPRVSLIVPVYRAERWIAECTASIQAQTYKDVELLVIDDAQGSGAWAARNRGLAKAGGEFIAFCDADDYLSPDALEKMVAAMDGADMVAASFRKFGEFEMTVSHETKLMQDWQVAHYAMGNMRNPRANQLLSGCWAKLYRRGLVGTFPPLTTAEDMALNFDCLTRCSNVRFLSDVVYHNRKRTGSLSTTFSDDNRAGLFGFMDALKYVKRFLLEFYPPGEVEDALDSSKTYHAILYAQRIGQDALKKVFPL